jgi:hypothetical protein
MRTVVAEAHEYGVYVLEVIAGVCYGPLLLQVTRPVAGGRAEPWRC